MQKFLQTRHACQACRPTPQTLFCDPISPLQVHLLDARSPQEANLVRVEPRRPGLEYFVEHNGGRLYIMTNAASEEFALMTTAAHEPQMRCLTPSFEHTCMLPHCHLLCQVINGGGPITKGSCCAGRHWKPLLPDRPGVITENLEMFKSAAVLYERHAGGLPALCILPIADGACACIPMCANVSWKSFIEHHLRCLKACSPSLP